MGNPVESKVKNALFGWNDIQSIRRHKTSLCCL
ncbi:hypothetical protein [Adlercreutzia equolifaciens]